MKGVAMPRPLSFTPCGGRARRYTLIEILTVMSIIVVLAAMAFWTYGPIMDGVRRKKTISQLQVIILALERYQEEHGYYPQLNESELDNSFWNNCKDNNGKNIRDWQGAGLDSNSTYGFVDPFGNPWWYDALAPVMNPQKYDLWSMGKDGQHGSGGGTTNAANARTTAADSSDDVSNWKPLN